jgi:hypothetical protein
MKKIFIAILILASFNSFGQTKKYAERLNANGIIDSFYIKIPISLDSIFNYSNNAFVDFTLEYYLRSGLKFPAAFSNFHLDADGVWRNFTPRSNYSQTTDSAIHATRADVRKVRDSVQANVNIKSTIYFGLDAQASDSYVITASPVPASYVTGMIIIFRAQTANTTAATINVNGLGVKNIVKRVSTTMATGDILALMYCYLVYDGTNFIMINPVVN